MVTVSAPHPGQHLIFRKFITMRNGKRLYAFQVGIKAFAFWVDDQPKNTTKKSKN